MLQCARLPRRCLALSLQSTETDTISKKAERAFFLMADWKAFDGLQLSLRDEQLRLLTGAYLMSADVHVEW